MMPNTVGFGTATILPPGNPHNYYGGFTVGYLLKAVYYGLFYFFYEAVTGYRYILDCLLDQEFIM
jgi:hypothetical protein